MSNCVGARRTSVNRENKPSYVSGSYESIYSPTRSTPLSPHHEARTPATAATMTPVTAATMTPSTPATVTSSSKGDFEAYLSNWRKTSTTG